MTTDYPLRRTGLGRRVADIVGGNDHVHSRDAAGGLLAGPVVVPLELVPFPMLVADSAGRVLAANRRWMRLTGLAVPDSYGSGWLAAVAEADRGPLCAMVAAVAGGAPLRRVEFRLAGGSPQRLVWWLAAHERAGQRLVGIAVGEAAGRSVLPAAPGGPAPGRPVLPGGAAAGRPVPDEMVGLLTSLRALLDSLDLLVERLPAFEEIPA